MQEKSNHWSEKIKNKKKKSVQVCTVAHKSHDPCFHKKYVEAGVMTFVAHCTEFQTSFLISVNFLF